MSTVIVPPATSVAPPRRRSRTSGLYRIDADATTVTVTARSFGVPVRGRFGSIAGCIDIHEDVRRSRVSVTANAATFSTGLEIRDRKVRERLLDAEAHPSLIFEADRLEPVVTPMVAPDGTRPLWELVGTLKVRGVRHPVRIAVGPVHPSSASGTLEFHGTVTVRRGDLGIGGYRGLVGDRLDVTIVGRADRVC